jgi:DNA-binding NtrC family response regulator
MMYIVQDMPKKILIADDDMDGQQLLLDLLEINFRDVRVERALSPQSFWEKIAANESDESWYMILVSMEYIKEDPTFIDRLKDTSLDALGKTIIMGLQDELETLNEDIKNLPYLSKPFSLDEFEAIVKDV